jgi:predicted transcriptional regulator
MMPHNSIRVLEFIDKNPGCHFRKIKNQLGLSIGTIQYQLNKLEKEGKIISLHKGFYKFYYPCGIFQEHQKEILQVLNHESLRNILLYIIENKNPTKGEIASHFNISYSSTNWHIERLISYGMIIESKDGKFIRYSINNSGYSVVSEIIRLLQNYYKCVWDRWANRLAEIFLLLSDEDKK